MTTKKNTKNFNKRFNITRLQQMTRRWKHTKKSLNAIAMKLNYFKYLLLVIESNLASISMNDSERLMDFEKRANVLKQVARNETKQVKLIKNAVSFHFLVKLTVNR